MKIPVGLGDTSVMRLKRIIISPKTFDLSLNMYDCSNREQQIRGT